MARSSAASAVPRLADVSSAEYRLLGADGAELEAGSGDVTVAGGVLELQPAEPAPRCASRPAGSPRSPSPSRSSSSSRSPTGAALELSRLGRMRTQLLAELRRRAGRGRRGGVGRGRRRRPGSPERWRVPRSTCTSSTTRVLIMAGGQAKRIAFSFVADVRARDYTVTVDVAGQDALAITRLGRRTDEFAALLAERLREARNRTSAFLGSLLPGLDPMALRAAAGLLRDGVAVPARALDAIHPELSATLLRVATLPDRLAAVAAPRGPGRPGDRLQAGDLGPPGGGRRHPVARPVRDAAHRRARQPGRAVRPRPRRRAGGRALTSGLWGPAVTGLAAGTAAAATAARSAAVPAATGGWRLLGVPRARRRAEPHPGGQHPMTPRADVRRGLLTPETEDLAALTTSGADPTVLAFALLTPARRRRPGRLRGTQPARAAPPTSTGRAAPTRAPWSTRRSTTRASPPRRSTPRPRAT